ncbi:uncharacterized protein TM35_000082630 [Trypanosoma theileri]|uniref:Uncharacterized protein n=1 Tax=Trypanosoma theileri TaxID=67003 RepID=A0A1X0P0N3_9TRYP|nr:uncharacterized protein TM35_000082630 [Trypanosoma theileri]ORC90465.1 hypothetical protein TM35_000082630 [Trypanosoma theileri]
MQRSQWLFTSLSSSLFHPTALRRQCGSGGCGGCGGISNIENFAKIFSDAQKNASGGGPNADLFDGRFMGGSPTMDPSMLQNMHQTLKQSLTPEMRDSMRAMMEGLQRGDGLPQMGMMAFGVGENEKGKKVARGAKLAYDPNTGKFTKDFVEKQIEEDDPMLSSGKTEHYKAEDDIEVQFEEDAKQHAGKAPEKIAEMEVTVEEPLGNTNRGSNDGRK